MARHVMLGNGTLAVGLDRHGYVHDFYYPYVGQENLTTARSQPHHVGVWIDGTFSWLHDDVWQAAVDFQSDQLVAHCTYTHVSLGISIVTKDFVDSEQAIFGRSFKCINTTDRDMNVRVFFHQAFEISADGRADTVMYVPEDHYILDYKGATRLLAYAECEDGTPFDQFAAGSAGIEGKEGTFRDAEDGELSMSTVEHAGVDSTIRCSTVVPAQDVARVRYWLCAADTPHKLIDLHRSMLDGGFLAKLQDTREYWESWLLPAQRRLEAAPEPYRSVALKSLMVIKAHTDRHGGIIAACDSSIYNYGRDYYSYVWPRDGFYALRPLIRMGYTHEVEKFILFCVKTAHDDGYMMHKYQPDGSIGSTWHPLVQDNHAELAIQEDETASLLILIEQYLDQTDNAEFVREIYPFVQKAADFMANFIDTETGLPHASYDLWEEKFLTSTYTTAITYRALMSAASIAKYLHKNDHASVWHMTAQSIRSKQKQLYTPDSMTFAKGLLVRNGAITHDTVLDVSSVYAAWYYELAQDLDVVAQNVAAIEERLVAATPIGGSPRYEHDAYFRSNPAHLGNPWFVTSLWLGQYYAATDQADKAQSYLDWSTNSTLPSGMLSEQLNPSTGEPVGVTPLVWSHAEYVNLVLDLYC